MKFIWGLMILVVGVIILAYNLGGVGSLDPAQQGEKLKAEVTPGTSWEKVVAERPPRKYQIFVLDDKGFTSGGADMKFDKATFEKDMANKVYTMGFQFFYIYGGESQFVVSFDSDGKVTSVDKMMTMGDLMNPK